MGELTIKKNLNLLLGVQLSRTTKMLGHRVKEGTKVKIEGTFPKKLKLGIKMRH